MRQPKHSRRSGYSLLELTLALALSGVILGSMVTATQTTEQLYRSAMTQLQVEAKLRRGLARVVNELAPAIGSSLNPNPQAVGPVTDLTFQPVIGLDVDGNPEPGFSQRLFLRLGDDEVDDGVDNDGDGLVDERELILVRDVGEPSERTVVLVKNVLELLEGEEENGEDDNGNGLVDEPGFIVTREGARLQVRLSLGKADSEGRLLERTLGSAIRLRNGV